MPSKELGEELGKIADACEKAAARLSKKKVVATLDKLRESVKSAASAASGSWIGYHATTYIRDLRKRKPSEHFDAEWGIAPGLNTTTAGDWVTYDHADLEAHLVKRAGVAPEEIRGIADEAAEVGTVYDGAKAEIVPLLDALLFERELPFLREAREAIAKTASHTTVQGMINAVRPEKWASRDQRAMTGGLVAPPHVMLAMRVEEIASYGKRAEMLAKHARHIQKFLERSAAMAPPAASPAVESGDMAKSGGWDPKSFEDVVSRLEESTMALALNVTKTRTCPAPTWDPGRAYRVAMVGTVPTIQRMIGGKWEVAPLEAPEEKRGDPMAKRERTTETRLFISHSSEDAELAKRLTDLIDGALTVQSAARIRCTSVIGYKLEPGADGPDHLRANLNDSDVVIGLLTPSSLASAFVLMELGAAWGFKSWVVPLLAAGVEFKSIPRPIGPDVHGVQASDDAAMMQLLDTISKRCDMPSRAPSEKRLALVKDFVSFAAAYRGREAASSPSNAAAPAKPAADPPPARLTDDDCVGRIRIWLHDAEDKDDPRTKGRPFQMTEIDAEVGLPAGTTTRLIDQALDQNWEVIRRHGVYVELLYSPRVRDVRGSRRYR